MPGIGCLFGSKDAQAKLALWFPPGPLPVRTKAAPPPQNVSTSKPVMPASEGEKLSTQSAKSVPLTVDVLKDKRQQHLWCVTDDSGGYVLTLTDEGGRPMSVYCSFVPSEEIKYVVNYQKKKFGTVLGDGSRIAVNFLDLTHGKERCWVDALNHLNDEGLKRQVEEAMESMLRTHKVVAEYFAYQGG